MGGVYFVLGVCEMVFIDNAPIQTVLLEKLHLLLVESPGGGLWYVEALLWMIVVVFFTYKKPSDLTVYLGGLNSTLSPESYMDPK